jgi:hypothetical protein
MRRLVPLVLLAPLVVVLVACGGQKATDEGGPIASAVEKTIEQGSEKTNTSGTVAFGGQTLRFSGVGGFNHATQEGYQELDVEVPAGGTTSVDEVFVKNTFWIKSPLFASSLPSGKEWVKVDLARANKALGFNFKALLGQTPDDALELLSRTAGTVTTLGEEEIDGVQTTHYRARVDPRKVPPKDKLQQLTAAVYEPIDVWIDDDDLVRQVRLDYTAKADPARPERARTKLTMKLSDFGLTVDVEPPAASLVVDSTATTESG